MCLHTRVWEVGYFGVSYLELDILGFFLFLITYCMCDQSTKEVVFK